MQLSITNFRGISRAQLDLTKIALLAGPNEAGKSSAAQAAAACLTLEPIPIHGIKKTSAGVLVRSGTASGTAMLSTTEGQVTVTWPAAKVTGEGEPPHASPFAAGMQSILNMDDKERAKTLQSYLRAVPVKDDLVKQLAPLNMPDTTIDKLWELITTKGWDGAYQQIKETGAKMKGAWEQVTGDNYGSKKAATWIPNGYEPDLDGASEDTLSRTVTDAKDALEAAIASAAVDNSKQADLEALADKLPAWKIDLLAAENATVDPAMGHQLKECDEFIAGLQEKRTSLTSERDALPKPERIAQGVPCPHCNTALVINGDKLSILQSTITEDEIIVRKEAIAEADKKINGLNDMIAAHQNNSARIRSQIQTAENNRLAKIAECKQLVKQAEDAAKELDQQPEPGRPGVVPNDSIDDHRTALARAETRLRAYKQKHEADRLHGGITVNAELQTKISPEGIRGDVLAKALGRFNAELAPLCKAANWRAVEIGGDFMPTYGGEQYMLLSESAKYRVRVILQVAMARVDGSTCLVIDAADILDRGGRNGLFTLLAVVGMPALVCMTINSADQVPNLSAAGIGVAYWLDGGVAGVVA